MNKTIVACDPGVNGGFAIHTKDGILLFPMPESLPDMAQLLTGFKLADSHLWIEKVPKFVSKLTPAASVATLHENYGIIQGLAYSQGYALHRVEPRVWQEPLGLGGRLWLVASLCPLRARLRRRSLGFRIWTSTIRRSGLRRG